MPYAFAHPAAVVPVAKLLGRRAVPSALAIGSMVPDAWYFIPLLDRVHTHGALALWFCVPAGLVVYAAFHLIFKQPMLALMPRRLAERLAALSPPELPAVPWLSVVVSLAAGIATHIAWDSFTHEGHLPLLDGEVAGVRLYRILQHASTLAGSAFLAWWLWRKLAATPPRSSAVELSPRLRTAVAAVLMLLPAVVFFSVLRYFDGEHIRLALRAAGVTAASAFGLAALSFALAWKALR
jgi:hypothetical protein